MGPEQGCLGGRTVEGPNDDDDLQHLWSSRQRRHGWPGLHTSCGLDRRRCLWLRADPAVLATARSGLRADLRLPWLDLLERDRFHSVTGEDGPHPGSLAFRQLRLG